MSSACQVWSAGAVSARAALAKRAGRTTQEDEGEFAQLESIITKELDRVRIREIKEANIHNLVEHVIREMKNCLPDDPLDDPAVPPVRSE